MTKGRAILSSSIILSIGFGVLILSRFVPIMHFGFLTSVIMLTAVVGDLVVLPAIINMKKKAKMKIRHFLYNAFVIEEGAVKTRDRPRSEFSYRQVRQPDSSFRVARRHSYPGNARRPRPLLVRGQTRAGVWGSCRLRKRTRAKKRTKKDFAASSKATTLSLRKFR